MIRATEPSKSPFIDERYDPLIISAMPARFEDLELDRFLARHEWLLDRGKRYATITDLSGLVGLPEAATRRRIADWNNGIEARARRYTIATAVIAPNSLLRGAMTALHWLSPPPYPQAIVADSAAAIDALDDFYRKSGEPAPDVLAIYRADLRRSPRARAGA